MTQTPFDQLAKQYLEEFLAPFGRVERQYEIPGEAKYADVWFVPDRETATQIEDLGILGQMLQTSALLEAFRNAPTRREFKTCLLKLLWIQEDEERKAETAKQTLSEDSLSKLWILAATTTRPVIQAFKGESVAEWLPGIYFCGEGFRTAIVAIDQLPETEETLWLRVLGRDATLERAVREVLALPPTHPRRSNILKLLSNWKVTIGIEELEEFTGREAVMALSEAYLEWEQQVEARGIEQGIERGIERGIEQGERSLILRLLKRRVGDLPEPVQAQIESLSSEQIESLAEALSDFSALSELEQWLATQ